MYLWVKNFPQFNFACRGRQSTVAVFGATFSTLSAFFHGAIFSLLLEFNSILVSSLSHIVLQMTLFIFAINERLKAKHESLVFSVR